MYLVLFSILLVWFLMSYYRWKKNVYDHLARIPGPMRIPILGTLYIYIGVPREGIVAVHNRLYDKFGSLYCTWSGSLPEVHVTKAEHSELILNNSAYITKGSQYVHLKPFFEEGLVTSTGAKWHQRRKLIGPTFNYKILKNFMYVFVEKIEMLIKVLDAKADGSVLDIYKYMNLCALDIICESAMGVSVNAISEQNTAFIDSVQHMEEIAFWRMLRPYVSNFAFKILPQGRRYYKNLKIAHQFVEEVIFQRRKQMQRKQNDGERHDNDNSDICGTKKYLSFLNLLLNLSEDGKTLSDHDIKEEVNTILSAGYDTTATATSWTLFLLGNHPEIQEKVFEEVRGILQGKLTPISIEELNELKYLDCVMKESLRLYPSIPVITRRIEKEIQIDKYRIPAGAEVFIHIHQLHKNTEYYVNPNKFDPERFFPENTIGRHPFAYIPFSAGLRNCVGQKFATYEEKTMLATIINRYKVTAIQTPKDMKLIPEITLRPLDGIFLKLERRELDK